MGKTDILENEAIVRRYLEVGWGEGRADILEEILDPECKRHLHGAVTGSINATDTMRAFRTAFPDARVEIELLFGKDDLVVCRSITHGTHSAPYLGLAATGRNISLSAVDFFRVKDGRIVESWHNVDEMGLRRSLGAL